MPLSDAKLRVLKPRSTNIKVADGGGLHVLVKPNGSKLWRMSYRYGGRHKTLSFGVYPATTLALARERRDDAKRQLAQGIDPAGHVRAARQQRLNAARNTFAFLAEELLAKAEREGKAATTIEKKRWLLNMAMQDFGAYPINSIKPVDVLVPLRRIEGQGNLETARRLRATIGQVFRFAIATARAEVDPTHGLRGAIATPRTTHRAALTEKPDFARLIRAVWSYEGHVETRIGLQLLALLYPRPGELRLAAWSEFDLARCMWTIPAVRSKMRREQRKPLPPLAIELLAELKDFTGVRELAFHSPLSRRKPLSENAFNGALRRMGFAQDEASAHGFRASASSLLNESGLWSADAIEAELGHVTANQVRRAYHRATYWDERVRMAAWWANEIAQMARAESKASASDDQIKLTP